MSTINGCKVLGFCGIKADLHPTTKQKRTQLLVIYMLKIVNNAQISDKYFECVQLSTKNKEQGTNNN